MPRVAWENQARAKRASLYAAIPTKWRLKPSDIPSLDGPSDVSQLPRKFLTEFEVAITESSPLDVLSNIHTGIWLARDVTEAYCHRAAIAHQLVNCLTEILFDAAVEQAHQLDQHRLATGGLKGPLHGLPVSFMDRFRIAGVETAAGYIGWLGKPEDEESESLVVKQMRNLGAIPFCKTNMPMSMMLGETSNNITGSSMNPFLRSLSSGGAAGGNIFQYNISS
jgi:amidase